MIGTTISDFVSIAAGEISRISIHVVHDDGRAFGGCGTADPGAERNPRVRRRFPDERPEHQFISLEQVDPHPRVGRHLLFEQMDRTFQGAPDIGLLANGGDDTRRRVLVLTVLVNVTGH
jgi:hypothetical protein